MRENSSPESFSIQNIKNPQLIWDSNLVPEACLYQDVYYSREDGLLESRHVFLEGNHLHERMDGDLVIGELGFGTGLNFLATWKLWKEKNDSLKKDQQKSLCFISCESAPLTQGEIHKAIARWPELDLIRDLLLMQYPGKGPGFYQLSFENGKVKLLLLFGEAKEMFEELETPGVDAWFLDGFSPTKNPSLWSLELFRVLKEQSKAGTTLASYSVASSVKKNLLEAGFEISKKKGFGRKREMLIGNLKKASFAVSSGQTLQEQPWYSLPISSIPKTSVIVIGGGIAGTSVAHSLAQREVSVTLIEREESLSLGASGNPAALLAPLLTAVPQPMSLLSFSAFEYTIHKIKNLQSDGYAIDHELGGVFQCPTFHKSESRLKQALESFQFSREDVMWVDQEDTSVLLGAELQEGGVFFKKAGWVNPVQFCNQLVQSQKEKIQTVFSKEVVKLNQRKDGEWEVFTQKEGMLASAPIVVVANGADLGGLFPSLPCRPLRGQVNSVKSGGELGMILNSLKMPVLKNGYLIPRLKGEPVFGATHERDRPQSLMEATEENFNKVAELFKDASMMNKITEWASALSKYPEIQSRSSVRATSPDSFPMIGAIPDEQYVRTEYHDLYHGRHWKPFQRCKHQPGLYVSAGFGGRGMVLAPFAGELLASLITSETLPIQKTILDALNPVRFWIRELRKPPENRGEER